MKTLYMEQPELVTHRARIVEICSGEINKKSYHWIVLDETIFHPKGGGQPSDEGTINGIKVDYIHKEIPDRTYIDRFNVFHCFETDVPFSVGMEVELKIDPDKRRKHTILHTAGHLIADVVQNLYPELQAYHGHHYPQDSYVKFKGTIDDKEALKAATQKELDTRITHDAPVQIVKHASGLRAIQILGNAVPCGGTHLKSLHEIGKLQITDISINKKEGTVTVKYI